MAATIRHRVLMLRIPLLLFLLAAPGAAFYPIEINGVSLYWASLPVSYVIQSQGSDDISDASDDLALRQAFQAWEDVPTSSVTFSEDLAADADRTDFAASDIHLILFDEDDSSGYFGGSSSIVAITPITFNTGTGQIIDADIIFNGDDHSFSTDKSAGTFDVQSIATHEIGHLIGLDHTAILSSTMIPFAALARTHPRALTSDDEGGAGEIYAGGAGTGSITGTVLRAGLSLLRAGHVVAINDDGIVIASTYSSSTGTFTLSQLPPDTYQVYVEPLDGPVTSFNISSTVALSATTNFESTYVGGNDTPTDLIVLASAVTNAGTFNTGANDSVKLTSALQYPTRAPRNALSVVTIFGSGLSAGDTLIATGNGVSVSMSTFFNFGGITGHVVTLSVAAGATLGPSNLRVTTPGSLDAFLTGVVEVVEPLPTLTMVSPRNGDISGGTVLTLTGTNFQVGAIVIVGDGLGTSVSVDSVMQITATTPVGSGGSVDVIVQNPDGEIALLADGYTYTITPTISALYPTAGSDAGGTDITISGSDFVPGLAVTVGGTSATVQQVTSSAVVCTTPAGVAGAADVVVTNPGMLSDTLGGGYTYLAQADPTISSISPSSGDTAGGTTVTFNGSGFDSSAQVYFGGDGTGGGTLADSVNVESSTVITAVTPAQSAGAAQVRVENPNGSVAFSGTNYTFVEPLSPGGGGGGGCLWLPPASRGGRAGSAGGLLPYLLILLLLAMRAATRSSGNGARSASASPGK
ncbi:MAG: IPT/TIG domain-containing protein [Planctomycetota bacterium]